MLKVNKAEVDARPMNSDDVGLNVVRCWADRDRELYQRVKKAACAFGLTLGYKALPAVSSDSGHSPKLHRLPST